MDQNWLNKWNERYENDDYAYGLQPNEYLAEQLAKWPVGKILFPAEGEGRNAVFAAQLGWEVSAFDISQAGQQKAQALAAAKNVHIDYQVGELQHLDYAPNSFDAIALIFAHFPASIKSSLHKMLVTLLKPGGIVIFEAFSKNHLAYLEKDEKVGGPKDIASLFSIEEIQADFKNFTFDILQEAIITLREGTFHNGQGAVIRFIARKN
ncbi:methyltransferase family protein [Chitinophaga skermanii]|uniref:Methyltransferase family protein n=1 Tax=Chitinophaga skermanii TaxID=331697 RepID=A0A327QYK3_9BACT|nr:class I SAM-dependent methyltransferase [Chitinophaga skermanii]RAJ08702.1 methyltransferase family protein [Chitinophaga skermanii]